MKHGARLIIVVAAVGAAFAALGMTLAGAAAVSPAGISPASTLPPTVTPTPTATPVFTAALSVEAEPAQLGVGETLTITIDRKVSAGCEYPIFELRLKQADGEAIIFDHIDPPGDVITGGLLIPSVWTFRAVQPGTATFAARSYGEKNCGDGWMWHYVNGISGPVRVGSWPYSVWLPAVSR